MSNVTVTVHGGSVALETKDLVLVCCDNCRELSIESRYDVPSSCSACGVYGGVRKFKMNRETIGDLLVNDQLPHTG